MPVVASEGEHLICILAPAVVVAERGFRNVSKDEDMLGKVLRFLLTNDPTWV